MGKVRWLWLYPVEDVSTNNCGSGNQHEGGAIRVNGGTLILDGNTFTDAAVGERNCFASSVRLEGGSGHRILGNTWTDQTMDALFVNTAVIEISDNVMNAGANPQAVDECVFIASQGGQDLWLTGNLCANQEYSAVIANGNEGGVLYIVHNTFVRNGRTGLSAVRRGNGRPLIFRNNVYLANSPAGIQANNGSTNLDLAYEAVTGSALCTPNCNAAMVDATSLIIGGDFLFADGSGEDRAALTPQPTSPLANSGTDWLDRNGTLPGRFNGAGPERGAIELP